MDPAQLDARVKAAKLIAICRAGFTNEHHWQAWLKKHIREIEDLPDGERKAVLMAWNNSTAREFSK